MYIEYTPISNQVQTTVVRITLGWVVDRSFTPIALWATPSHMTSSAGHGYQPGGGAAALRHNQPFEGGGDEMKALFSSGLRRSCWRRPLSSSVWPLLQRELLTITPSGTPRTHYEMYVGKYSAASSISPPGLIRMNSVLIHRPSCGLHVRLSRVG